MMCLSYNSFVLFNSCKLMLNSTVMWRTLQCGTSTTTIQSIHLFQNLAARQPANIYQLAFVELVYGGNNGGSKNLYEITSSHFLWRKCTYGENKVGNKP